jgi:hypothetical protein
MSAMCRQCSTEENRLPASGDIFISFGADTGGLEAALAVTKAQVAQATRELTALGREMAKTGAKADSDLGQRVAAAGANLATTKARVEELKDTLSTLGGSGSAAKAVTNVAHAIESTGTAASHAHTGIGFYVREIHALFDEFGSGRDRQAIGTLSNVIGTTLQSNLALIPYAAAIGLVGAAFGYLIYEATTANTAIKGIQLDAVVAQFKITDTEAGKLKNWIQALTTGFTDLFETSSENAEAILKPFLALGKGGDILAKTVAPYLPMLAAQMGEKMPKAAEKLAESFADLSGKGARFIEQTVGMTLAQSKQFEGFRTAGQEGQAWGIVLEALQSRLKETKDETELQSAALYDQRMAAMAAGSGINYANAADANFGTTLQATTARLREQDAALAQFHQELNGVINAQQIYATAARTSLGLNKAGAEIDETTGKIKELEAGLALARLGNDRSAIDSWSTSLDIARDKIKKLRQEADAGTGGGDLVSNMKRQFEIDDSSAKGPDADRLRQHQQAMEQQLAGDTITAEQRKQLEVDVAQNARAIQNAENESYLRQDEIKVRAAGKNSAAVIAIRENEVRREIAGYGEGSKQAEDAEDRLARAKEQAANRGAAAGAKAAKAELAGEQESYAQQIATAEKVAQGKIKLYGLELKAKEITERQKLSLTLAALAQERAAVDAAYSSELALAGNNAKKIEELQGQMKTFNLENTNAVLDAQTEAAAKTRQTWDSAFKQINSSFDSQIDGLLKGTTSWASAFKNILSSLTEDVIKFFVNWGLQEVEKTAMSMSLGNTEVAAAVAGDATKAASATAANATGLAGMIANAFHAITVDAGQTAAGVTAFLAPVLGPAAPAAGLAAGSSVLSMAAFDIGAWNVPSTQVAMVHQNELIMPAAQAGAFRDMLSNGGTGGGDGGEMHFHYAPNVQAMDATGVMNVLQNHGRLFAAQIANQFNRNPTLRPSY